MACQLCDEEYVLTVLHCGLNLVFGALKKKKRNKISKSNNIVFKPGVFLNVGTTALRNVGFQHASLSSAQPGFTVEAPLNFLFNWKVLYCF